MLGYQRRDRSHRQRGPVYPGSDPISRVGDAASSTIVKYGMVTAAVVSLTSLCFKMMRPDTSVNPNNTSTALELRDSSLKIAQKMEALLSSLENAESFSVDTERGYVKVSDAASEGVKAALADLEQEWVVASQNKDIRTIHELVYVGVSAKELYPSGENSGLPLVVQILNFKKSCSFHKFVGLH